MKKFLFLFLIWGISSFLISNVLRFYNADKSYIKSVKYSENGDFEMASKLADRAIKLNPSEPIYFKNRAKINLAKIMLPNNTDTFQKDLFRKIYLDLKAAYDLNPNNLVTIRNAVPLYYFLADLDPDYYGITINYFKENKEKYAHDAGVISLIAKYERKLGLSDDYAKSVEMVKQLRPDLLEWHEAFIK